MSGRYIEPDTFTLIFDMMSDENKEKFIRSKNFRRETNVLKETLLSHCKEHCPKFASLIENQKENVILKGKVPMDQAVEWFAYNPKSYRSNRSEENYLKKLYDLYWSKMTDKQKHVAGNWTYFEDWAREYEANKK